MKKEFTNVPMSLDDVAKVIKNYNLSRNTARVVGVYLSGQAKTKAEAYKSVGTDPMQLSHALKRMTIETTCECCGGAIKTISIERLDK